MQHKPLHFLRPPPGNRLEALKNAKRIAREVLTRFRMSL